MRRLLTLVYRGEHEPGRIFKLLRRFQATSHLLGRGLPAHLSEAFEEHYEELQPAQEGGMTEKYIIGIAYNRARNQWGL